MTLGQVVVRDHHEGCYLMKEEGQSGFDYDESAMMGMANNYMH
jgi:hypothetical protein